jgi:hypothetical protein
VLMVPAAIVISGIVWLVSARVSGRVSGRMSARQ